MNPTDYPNIAGEPAKNKRIEMDSAIQSKRKYPAYTTAQLKAFVAEIKGNEVASTDAYNQMEAFQIEIDRRESGEAPITVIPQIVPTSHDWLERLTELQKEYVAVQEKTFHSSWEDFLFGKLMDAERSTTK